VKIDRSKVTPEIMDQMRETLFIAGVDHTDMSDERVIERIERIIELMIEFGQIIRKIIEPVKIEILSFVESPTGQSLVNLAREQELLARTVERR
jgi:hypothetical protein